jgi:Cft2 family RNA processing exonuclease
MSETAPITLSFLGGASDIGASCALLEVGEIRLLIDAGVRFQAGNELPNLDELSGKGLNAILITHAHSDHTGSLPVVHEAYPQVPIYMTPPTLDLITILQRDALLLMDKASREGDFPLYGKEQVERMLSSIHPVHHGDSITIDSVEITYLPASHILGASMIHIATESGNILFTGDYCVTAQKTVPALIRPTLPVDLLITESTYGNRLHADRTIAEQKLITRISEVVSQEGRVLIPAFAIGRAQEVLLILRQAIQNKKLPAVPVFVDGMVRPVCQVYRDHPRYITNYLLKEIRKSPHPFYNKYIQDVKNVEDRKKVLETRPCVIVTSSGMLSGGPSAFYAEEFVKQEKDAILITGYQDEESPGRALLKLLEAEGPKEFKLNGKMVPVHCHFESYSLSAHADRMQMVGLIEALKPKTVFLVHGDREAKESFAKTLTCKDIEITENGMHFTRHYGRKAKVRKNKNIPELVLTPQQAQSLLSGSKGRPLRIEHLSESWFGKEVPFALREQFIEKLEQAGFAKRDDQHRNLVWPLVALPESTETSENPQYQELKEKNPKGRLLEFCARNKMAFPESLERSQAHEDSCAIEMQLTLEGKTFSSGIHRSPSRTLSEHLASASLLEQLTQHFQKEAETIDPESEERLKISNPKGRLIEHCMKHKYPKPSFSTHPVPFGFQGNAQIVFSKRLCKVKPIKEKTSKS